MLRRLLLVGTAALLAVGSAQAADTKYPTKDLDFIIGYSAGGGNDLITRAVIPPMEKILGVSVVPTNIPGASGATGAKKILAAEPEYAFGLYSATIISIQYTGLSGLNIKDFDPVATLVEDTAVVTVPSDSPFKTLKDLIDYAKANPGKLKMGNAGTGGIWHLAAAQLEKKAGVKFEAVPYKGGRPSLVAAAGHETQAVISNIAEAASLVENGSLRMLCVLSEQRNDSYPKVATAMEQGIDFSFPIWRGVFTKAGGPKDRLNKLASVFEQAVKDPKFVKFVKTSGLAVRFKGPEAFGKLVAEQNKLYSEILGELGLKVADPNK